ncbi:hypothetical protein B296_00029195 [Ensete ventricosum]|uniref:Uncharacterized protein n=1 Tax=Ensete ventricosum TaxID=4639 RepID=A0A426X6W1_ENSVE|nr:hypothetical protein B296_00029195 [Ensete ventricosum]
MFIPKAKDTDKHEHFIKHLVYILTVTLLRSTIEPTKSPPVPINAGVTHPFGSQPLSTTVVEQSNSDPPCYFNSPMTESGVGLVELC